MDFAHYAYKHALKAFRTMEALHNLRKGQNESSAQGYANLLSPFYFKLGDYLATFIELNTDEFGNVKPLPEGVESDSESECDEGDAEEAEESSAQVDEQQIDTTTV